MASLFRLARGCVYAVGGSQGGGFYKLRGLDTGGDPPILLVGADTTDSDIVMPVTTLDQTKIVYTFGQAFGDIRISGLVLLGSTGSNSTPLSRLTSWFNSNRASKNKSTVDFSMPGSSYRICVTGLGFSVPDSQFNIQPFVIFGLVVEPP